MFEKIHQSIDLSPAIRALEIGEYERALSWSEQAVDQYWKQGDPRAGDAFAVYSLASRAGGRRESVFRELGDLPDQCVYRLTKATLELAREFSSNWCVEALSDLWLLLGQRYGEDSKLACQVKAAIKEKSFDFDPAASVDPQLDANRIALRQQEILRLEVKKQMEQACEETIALARDLAAGGHYKEAVECYRSAIEGSSQLKDPTSRIAALRECGIFFDRIGQFEQSESLLRIAASVAKKARKREAYAEILASLGSCLFHMGNIESAKKALYQSLKQLGLAHEKSAPVLKHLDSINRGVTCDCERLHGGPVANIVDGTVIEVV